jgi:biopolymer transport protein ExbD
VIAADGGARYEDVMKVLDRLQARRRAESRAAGAAGRK